MYALLNEATWFEIVILTTKVRDDPKLPGDSGEGPISDGMVGSSFPIVNLLSTWKKKN